jgi:hypothetical protein
MLEINTLGAYIGMGIVVVGVAILWFLADKPKKPVKKTKHRPVHHHK